VKLFELSLAKEVNVELILVAMDQQLLLRLEVVEREELKMGVN
jgi:hypothetical protein